MLASQYVTLESLVHVEFFSIIRKECGARSEVHYCVQDIIEWDGEAYDANADKSNKRYLNGRDLRGWNEVC